MLCHTQLHNFNITVRYRAHDAPPDTYSWLGEGRRWIPLPWRGGSLPIPHPLETRCLLAPTSAHPPPKHGSRWRHCNERKCLRKGARYTTTRQIANSKWNKSLLNKTSACDIKSDSRSFQVLQTFSNSVISTDVCMSAVIHLPSNRINSIVVIRSEFKGLSKVTCSHIAKQLATFSNDTECRAVTLRQLSFLLSTVKWTAVKTSESARRL